jgi:catechol 2,3-dioxygenase-like lactoylglutathione lyase family enzyme
MTLLEGAIPVLPVRDVPRAVTFYRERLGFTPLFELGPYAGVKRGAAELHLDGSGPPTPPISARIAVRDVDALYAELERQRVIHPQEPLETKPFGMRQFSVLDADGNRITFAQPVPRAGATAAPAKRR